MVAFDRLVFEYVNACAPQLAGIERFGECHCVDNGSAGGVYDDGIGFHQGNRVRVEHVARVGRKRGVEAHHVGAAEELLVFHDVVAFGRAAPWHERARRAYHAEAEPRGLACGRASDFAHAHHAERAAVNLAQRAVAGVIPNARAHVRVGFVHAPQHAQGKGNGVVGNHFRAIAGHHAHGGFVFRCGRHVNRVVANARAAYDLQVWQRGEHFGRERAV